MRNLFTGIIVLLLAAGCTIHDPTYYTIYTPEKHSTNANSRSSGFATNGQMNATKQVNSGYTNGAATSPNGNGNGSVYLNSTSQSASNGSRTNYSGRIYTEAPNSSLSPVSSNSASRIYSEPSDKAQSFGRGLTAGIAPGGQDTQWFIQDEGLTASDRAIIGQIRQAWRQDDNLSLAGTGIKIVVNNGSVKIDGSVETRQEKAMLGALAQKIPGVITVQNQLVLKQGS